MRKIRLLVLVMLLFQIQYTFAEDVSDENDYCIFYFRVLDESGKAVSLENAFYYFEHESKISTNTSPLYTSKKTLYENNLYFRTGLDLNTGTNLYFLGYVNRPFFYKIYGQIGSEFYYFEGKVTYKGNGEKFVVSLSINSLNKVNFKVPFESKKNYKTMLSLIPKFGSEIDKDLDSMFTREVIDGSLTAWVPKNTFTPILYSKNDSKIEVIRLKDVEVENSETILLEIENDLMKKSVIRFPESFDEYILAFEDDVWMKWLKCFPIPPQRTVEITYNENTPLSVIPKIKNAEDYVLARQYSLVDQLTIGTYYHCTQISQYDSRKKSRRFLFQDDQKNSFYFIPWGSSYLDLNVSYHMPKSIEFAKPSLFEFDRLKTSILESMERTNDNYPLDVVHLQDPFYNGKSTFLYQGNGDWKLKTHHSSELEKSLEAKIQDQNLIISGKINNVCGTHRTYAVYWNTNGNKKLLDYVVVLPYQNKTYDIISQLSYGSSGYVTIEYEGIPLKRINIK